MPYILPENLTPPTRRCVRFFVPNEIWYEAAFWGAIQELLQSYNWEGDSASKAIVTETWEEVIETARQSWEEGDCDLPVQFRVAGGRIEYSPDSGATWQDIGDACNCETSQYVQPEYNPNISTYQERACNIATGLINWLMEKYNDNIDLVEAATDTVSAMDSIIAIFPPAYLIADAVLDAINEVSEAGASIARAYDTVDRREEMSQWLYCEMRETGELTEDLWAEFLTEFEDGEFGDMSPGGLAMRAYLEMFETDAVIARARIESYSDGNCAGFDCGDIWTHIFDFTTGKHGWDVANGAYTSGVGFTATVSGGTRYVRNFIDFPSTVLTYVRVVYDIALVGDRNAILQREGGVQIAEANGADGTDKEFIYSEEMVRTGLRFAIQGYESSSGSATIKLIELRGKGTKPANFT